MTDWILIIRGIIEISIAIAANLIMEKTRSDYIINLAKVIAIIVAVFGVLDVLRGMGYQIPL